MKKKKEVQGPVATTVVPLLLPEKPRYPLLGAYQKCGDLTYTIFVNLRQTTGKVNVNVKLPPSVYNFND
jgi:hypothetical protein